MQLHNHFIFFDHFYKFLQKGMLINKQLKFIYSEVISGMFGVPVNKVGSSTTSGQFGINKPSKINKIMVWLPKRHCILITYTIPTSLFPALYHI